MKTLVTRRPGQPKSSAWATWLRSTRPISPRDRRAHLRRGPLHSYVTAATSPWPAASARDWRISPARCCRRTGSGPARSSDGLRHPRCRRLFWCAAERSDHPSGTPCRLACRFPPPSWRPATAPAAPGRARSTCRPTSGMRCRTGPQQRLLHTVVRSHRTPATGLYQDSTAYTIIRPIRPVIHPDHAEPAPVQAATATQHPRPATTTAHRTGPVPPAARPAGRAQSQRPASAAPGAAVAPSSR